MPGNTAQNTQGISSSAEVRPVPAPYVLEVLPRTASVGDTLTVIAQGFSSSEARIEWVVNHIPRASGESTLQLKAGFKRGDLIFARATVKGNEVRSNEVALVNRLPDISNILWMDESNSTGGFLSVEAVGSDADGDPVTISYEWRKNGEFAGNRKRIVTPLRRGDKVDLRMIPFDGISQGDPVVLHREIANFPPRMPEHSPYEFDGKSLKFSVSASDPDGDLLSFRLQQGPTGMTVGPADGRVRWQVPKDFASQVDFTIAVSDGHGGEVSQRFSFSARVER